jgi:hypothetical protein
MEAGMASLYKKPVILNDPKTDKPVKTKSRKWLGDSRTNTASRQTHRISAAALPPPDRR